MNRIIVLFLLLISSLAGRDLFAIRSSPWFARQPVIQDSSRNRQILYNGQLWKNPYHSLKGDPFFFSDQFLPGTLLVSGHLFTGIGLKYDICTDQLLILKDSKDIIQVNKEMVNFFSLTTVNRVYRFVRITDDTLKNFTGYMNELYKGRASLYVKYIKEVENIITGQYLGKFNEMHRIYIKMDDRVWLVKNLSDVSRALNREKSDLKDFLKKNRLSVTNKYPESFIPLLQYFDSSQGNR